MLPSNFQWQLYVLKPKVVKGLTAIKLLQCGDHDDGGHTTCLGQSEASTQANQRLDPPALAAQRKTSRANGAKLHCIMKRFQLSFSFQ